MVQKLHPFEQNIPMWLIQGSIQKKSFIFLSSYYNVFSSLVCEMVLAICLFSYRPSQKARLSSVLLGAAMGNHYLRSKVNFGFILIPVSNCQLFELHYSYTNWPWIKQGYSSSPLSTSWVPRFWSAIKVAGTINRIVNVLWPFHLEANEKLIYFISSCRWAIQ